jgi:SagB-type dehydrogenase family enzyme
VNVGFRLSFVVPATEYSMPEPAPQPASDTEAVRRYHERTKHRLDGYAAGPDTLDWEDQPEAFRDFGDCPRTSLALADDGPGFAGLAAGNVLPVAPLGSDGLGRMLSCALGIATWKHYGTAHWAVRCNPSSGNLHPTEAYLALPGGAGPAAGLYHYRPQDHQLEQRCAYPAGLAERLFDGLPAGSFLLGLSAIPWREAWKYGERAWRYCQLDLGHALGALRYAAALQGWSVLALEHLADAEVAGLLGLDRADEFESDEPEYPELLCLVVPAGELPTAPYRLPEDLAEQVSALTWHGRANRLSARHDFQWPIIDEAIRAATKPLTPVPDTVAAELPAPAAFDCAVPAVDLIQRRRSAQAFDGSTGLSQDDFFAILDHTLPRTGLPPWGETPAPAAVHLVLFVHRVEGLPKGVYALPRRGDALPGMQTALRSEFQWQAVADAPAHLPLFQLIGADARRTAGRLACQQAIAADGAFSLAMLGEFEAGLAAGPWGYRQLMTEAGLVGQALYLGAEACGLQGTGIGCFFDDGLHELFGLQGADYQVLYQFTVGKGLVDTRITNQRPYPELRR